MYVASLRVSMWAESKRRQSLDIPNAVEKKFQRASDPGTMSSFDVVRKVTRLC